MKGKKAVQRDISRLLVPTKCWARKIGVPTIPDLREQRSEEDGLKDDSSCTFVSPVQLEVHLPR